MSDSSGSSSSVSLRSVSVVTLLSVGQMLLLFVLQLVLAEVFGASEHLDAYLAAYAFPLVVGGILSGGLGAVVVPLYNEQLAAHGPRAAEAELGRLGLILAGIAVGLALGLSLGAGFLIDRFYAGFDRQLAATAVEVLRILCWLVPLNTLTGFLFGVHHARRQFFLPAFVGLFGPGLTILLFTRFMEPTILSLAWAVLWGGVAGVALLLPYFPRGERMLALPGRAPLGRFLFLLTPLILGATYSRLDVLVDRPLAAGLSSGSISQMGYAWRIATAVVMLGTSGLSVVIFPALARHAAAGDDQQLRRDLAEGWRFLSVVLVPVIAGILVCGKPLIAALFERGQFTAHDVQAVTGLLHLYTGVIVAAGIGELASRTCFALGRMWLPTIVCMFGFTAGVAAKFLVVDRWGAAGLVAATSLYYLLNAGMLLGLLGLIGAGRCYAGLPVTILRSVAATAVAVGLAAAIMHPPTPLRVLGGVLTALLAYPLLLTLLGDAFARRAMAALRSVLRRSIP